MASRVGFTMSGAALDALIRRLGELGYETMGPVFREGGIMPGPVATLEDLPVGCHDEQAPGHYRVSAGADEEVFGWAVGPGSWKAQFFPSEQVLWRGSSEGTTVRLQTVEPPASRPMAIVGARPCELAALRVLDAVLMEPEHPDPHYAARRRGAFVVVAECGRPSGTCFCSSFGTGPGLDDCPPDAGAGDSNARGAEDGGTAEFDLALTEVRDEGGHRFIVRPGSQRGSDLLEDLAQRTGTDMWATTDEEWAARSRILEHASETMGLHLDTDDLPALLSRNLEHPRWADVAERCLACGNCTLVCPTCFCSDVHDTTDLDGGLARHRRWASCFDLDHSYTASGRIRRSTESRYRQWMTHKLSTWWDQFDMSGCVGCGRCVTWCPVGIDLTEEAAAIRATDGLVEGRSAHSEPGGASDSTT
jgi:sulfhydrogenase subunit beta (sulfur reductase)